MTKTAKTADVTVETVTNATTEQDRADMLERDAVYTRTRALENALTLHKQNGGMTLPERIIEDATKFLNFVKG